MRQICAGFQSDREAVSRLQRGDRRLVLVDDVLTIDKPAVFPVNKDRPILFSALATADVLLTLDRVDFGRLLGTHFYGLAIMTPGMWLVQESEVGRARR